MSCKESRLKSRKRSASTMSNEESQFCLAIGAVSADRTSLSALPTVPLSSNVGPHPRQNRERSPRSHDYIPFDSGSQISFTPATIPDSTPKDSQGHPLYYKDTEPGDFPEHPQNWTKDSSLQHRSLTTHTSEAPDPTELATPAATTLYDLILPEWLKARTKYSPPLAFRPAQTVPIRCPQCRQHVRVCTCPICEICDNVEEVCPCEPCSLCETKGSWCVCDICDNCHAKRNIDAKHFCDCFCKKCESQYDFSGDYEWAACRCNSSSTTVRSRKRKHEEIKESAEQRLAIMAPYKRREDIRNRAVTWITANQPEYFTNDDWHPTAPNSPIRVSDICGTYWIYSSNDYRCGLLIGCDGRALWGIIMNANRKHRSIFRTRAIPAYYSTIPLECKIGHKVSWRDWDWNAKAIRNGDTDDSHDIDGITFLGNGLVLLSLTVIDGARKADGALFAIKDRGLDAEKTQIRSMPERCEKVHTEKCGCVDDWESHEKREDGESCWGKRGGRPEIAWDEDVIDAWVDVMRL